MEGREGGKERGKEGGKEKEGIEVHVRNKRGREQESDKDIGESRDRGEEDTCRNTGMSGW